MTKNYGIKTKTGTSYNPQSNGVIERVHQVLGDMLRTFEMEERELDNKDPFGSFLSAAAYAIRSTYHTVLEASPAELVFGRHMLLPVKFNADWQAIQAKRQKRMEDSNAKENASRIEHEYKIGDLIMKTRPGKLAKLRRKRDGPYTDTHVYTNGTLRIRKGVWQRGSVSEGYHHITKENRTPYRILSSQFGKRMPYDRGVSLECTKVPTRLLPLLTHLPPLLRAREAPRCFTANSLIISTTRS
jgi:hypothetical protein